MTYDPKCLLKGDYFACPQDNPLTEETETKKSVSYKDEAKLSYDKGTCGNNVQYKNEVYRNEFIEMSDKNRYKILQVRAKKFSFGK